MARRRFVWSPEDDCLIEVGADFVQDPRSSDQLLWNDRHYDGLKSTDGADISSRAKHREYMRANNLTTVDDFKDTWAKAQQDRDDYRTGKKGSVNRSDIERAIHQLQESRERRR